MKPEKTVYDQWQEALRKNVSLHMTPKGLQMIDGMILEEKDKLEKLEKAGEEKNWTDIALMG
jgi:hypothetical protein